MAHVRYNTKGIDPFPTLDDPSMPPADHDALQEKLDRTTDAYVATNQTAKARALLLWTSQIVTHELGHNVNTDDHNPADGGDHRCVMRYLPFDDFPRDPIDRFDLRKRNPWPATFCDAETCTPRVQISDALAGASGVVPALARVPTALRRTPRGGGARPMGTLRRVGLRGFGRGVPTKVLGSQSQGIACLRLMPRFGPIQRRELVAARSQGIK